MLQLNRPTERELLSDFGNMLAEELLHLVRTEPDNIEKHDPIRLKLQAVRFYIQDPSK